jgi:Predicted membrane protein
MKFTNFKNYLNKLEYKYGKYAIHNLMPVLIGAMGIVFAADLLLSQYVSLYNAFTFDRAQIFSGQIWRVLTFVVLPPSSSLIFIIFSLYFYYLIGTSLEREWGALKFNIYYLIGIIGTIIAGLITGYADNYYLNMSLFFAFAMFYPDFQILLFFVLPVKIKWMAWLDAAFFIYLFIIGDWSARASIIAALLNFFIFFGSDFIGYGKSMIERLKLKWRYRGKHF